MEVSSRVLRSPLSPASVSDLQQSVLYGRRRTLNSTALAVADFTALGISTMLAACLAFWLTGTYTPPTWSILLLPGWYCGAALLNLLPSWGLGPVEELRRITILLILMYLSTGAAAAFSVQFGGNDIARSSYFALVISFFMSAGFVPLARRRTKQLLIEHRQWGVPAVVYGRGDGVKHIVDILLKERGLGFTPVGICDERSEGAARYRNIRVVAEPMTLGGLLAPVAVLSMPNLDRARAIELLEGPLSRYRTVLIIPDLLDVPSLWVKPRDLSGVLGLEIRCNLCSPSARVVKRTFDIVAVLASVPLWAPVCFAIAVLIWLEDRTNPFFYQERVGELRSTFATCKFRTMTPNAEAVLQHALENDPELRKKWELDFKLACDPRVTRVGRFLRKYSLDELPQLLNVLRGEMSLVGPRPLPAYHHDVLHPRVQNLRERVKPGITGLWQVSGRSDSGSTGMELFDPYYVRNWSLWLDAIILFRTFGVVVTSEGAY